MKFDLGSQKNGWIDVTFKHFDFELKFDASNIPQNPILSLYESLIFSLNGIQSEIIWNLEPEFFIFKIYPNKSEIYVIILKNIDAVENILYEFSIDFNTFILVIYRSLKKFHSLVTNKYECDKIEKLKLDKLKKLIDQKITKNK